jgi:hypothetical protein
MCRYILQQRIPYIRVFENVGTFQLKKTVSLIGIITFQSPLRRLYKPVGHNIKMTVKTSNIFFYSGISLLAIGAIGLTFAAYYAIIGLPIFIVGIILILVSKRTWKQRLIPIGVFIIGIISFWPIWTKINSIGPETFLISDNYQGRIRIIYGENCGSQLTKTEDRLTYSIPDDGILIVNQGLKYGIIDHKYYQIDLNGERTELPWMNVQDFNELHTIEKNPNEPPRDKFGIFKNVTGSVGDTQGTNDGYKFQEFYVSTYSDLKDKFGFKYNRRFDSIIENKVKDCRSQQ